jgi:D-alanyl-lipoteichoic acid acyltransferase DltB (MBOAT superfamily)
VIADRLAPYVDEVFNHPGKYDGIPVILACYFFAFQIYGDFAGYSNIARGTARILGFRLMKNFNSPYLAVNISDFWRRWHISLSTWFRDYLYIPLGGNRVPKHRRVLNLALVFLLSGLWHGASWNFVAWGALHALFLIFYITRPASPTPGHPLLSRLLTFHLVVFAWIFFRAESIPAAATLIQNLVPHTAVGYQWRLENFTSPFLFSVLLLLLCFQCWAAALLTIVQRQPLRWARWGVYQAMILAIVFLGTGDKSAFIYFQF